MADGGERQAANMPGNLTHSTAMPCYWMKDSSAIGEDLENCLSEVVCVHAVVGS